jgi:long-chain fatty acid transport protein
VLRYFVGSLIGLAFGLHATAVDASGFALREWSASAQGSAYAGATAGADDITFMAFNPAGLTRHEGSHAAFGAAYIAGHSEFSLDGATTVLTGAIGGGDGGGDGLPNSIAPSAYLSYQFSPRLFGGVSLTAPIGLITEYDRDWVGRYHAIDSEIKAIDLNPVLAYKVTPQLSIGGGLRVLYAQGRMSNAVDFGTIDVASLGNAFGGTPTLDDGYAEVEGDDIAFGFNFGILYQMTPSTRVGAAYRSKVDTELEGDARFNNGTVGDAISGALGNFVNTGMVAEVTFPEIVSFGIHHDINSQWSVMAEAAWTRWSRLQELRIKFDNPLQPDDLTNSEWEDTWFLALGATYRHNSKLTARIGRLIANSTGRALPVS